MVIKLLTDLTTHTHTMNELLEMVKLQQDLTNLTFNHLLNDLIAMPLFISTKPAEFTGRDAGQWHFASLRLFPSFLSYMKHTLS